MADDVSTRSDLYRPVDCRPTIGNLESVIARNPYITRRFGGTHGDGGLKLPEKTSQESGERILT